MRSEVGGSNDCKTCYSSREEWAAFGACNLAITLVLALLSLLAVGSASAQPVTAPSALLTRFGETKPAGWMLSQMQADLESGLAGNYPDISDSVNGRQFELQLANQPDAAGHPGWWLGEHEGYYADGLFRLAWLSGRQSAVTNAIARLEDVLSAQDFAGYIGVYSPDYRFGDQDPNDGELWTQSRMLQALLAWYEATGEQRILLAVKKAATLTLTEYTYRSYFERLAYATGGGGVSHGVGFADALEWLYRITDDPSYRDGYLWLYADYANSNVRDDDLTPTHLIDSDRPWYSHTPHIAEALAMPQIASAYGGSLEYAQAADEVLTKLRRHSNPGGGPVGDEGVEGRPGSFDLPSEYCAMTETIASLNRLAQYRDAMASGDIAERIALNAAQGARLHPAASAISYLTADNRIAATQSLTLGDRLLYSASHLTAACCSLNSTRLLPYYVEGMWLREASGAGLVARLYGPSIFDTKFGEIPVHIVEQTDFPFSDKIAFEISPESALYFRLTLRIPDYAKNVTVSVPTGMNVTRLVDRFEITGSWKAGDSVSLDLKFAVHAVRDSQGEVAVAYGPLLYALPIEANVTQGRLTRATGSTSQLEFHDTEYVAKEVPPTYLLPAQFNFLSVQLPGGDLLDPWSKPPAGLSGSLLAPDGSHVEVTLYPMGSTLLRVTGFRSDRIYSDAFGP